MLSSRMNVCNWLLSCPPTSSSLQTPLYWPSTLTHWNIDNTPAVYLFYFSLKIRHLHVGWNSYRRFRCYIIIVGVSPMTIDVCDGYITTQHLRIFVGATHAKRHVFVFSYNRKWKNKFQRRRYLQRKNNSRRAITYYAG